MKERKVVTVGKPSLKRLSKNESKVFYSTLLSAVLEYYKDKSKDSNNNTNDKGKSNTVKVNQLN